MWITSCIQKIDILFNKLNRILINLWQANLNYKSKSKSIVIKSR